MGEKYVPFLKENGIECSTRNQAMNGNMNQQGNMYAGNMYNHQRENYFPSGQEPGQFDEDPEDVNAGAADVEVVRQNSRENDSDADLYDHDDEDVNAGGAGVIVGGGDAGAAAVVVGMNEGGMDIAGVADNVANAGMIDDENVNDAQMEIQENESDNAEEQIMEDV